MSYLHLNGDDRRQRMLGRKAIVLLLFSIAVGIGLLLFTSTLQFANAAG